MLFSFCLNPVAGRSSSWGLPTTHFCNALPLRGATGYRYRLQPGLYFLAAPLKKRR
jgi:hypothetical protein